MPRLIALLICVAAGAQTFEFLPVPQEVIERRLAAFALDNREREAVLRKMFEEAGCAADKLTEQPVKGQKAPNVTCTLSGETASIIIVGANFDKARQGQGVVDNWSGASLLPSLYQGVAPKARKHTFRFVGFSDKEEQMVGSKSCAWDTHDRREAVAAMVNPDSLGLEESEVSYTRADMNLVRILEATAKALQLPISNMNLEQVGLSDAMSFRSVGIPAVTIHSLNMSTLPVVRTRYDGLDAIHKDRYYRSYQLVLGYLAALDQALN